MVNFALYDDGIVVVVVVGTSTLADGANATVVAIVEAKRMSFMMMADDVRFCLLIPSKRHQKSIFECRTYNTKPISNNISNIVPRGLLVVSWYDLFYFL